MIKKEWEVGVHDNQLSLRITPIPKRNRMDGIKIWFSRVPNPDYEVPTATADIKKGQDVYPLPDRDSKQFFVQDVKLKY